MAAFVLQQKSWVVVAETVGFHSLKYLPSEYREGLPDPYVEVIVYLHTIKAPHF